VGQLIDPQSNQIVDNSNGLAFHISLISSEDMAIDNLPDQIRAKREKSPVPSLNGGADFPQWSTEWRRGYRSVSYSSGYSRKLSVQIRADGLITISLVKADNRFHPACYSSVIAQGLMLAEWLRRWRGRPDIEFVLHGNFHKIGNPAVPTKFDGFESWVGIPWESAPIGPYSIASRNEFPVAHDIIERELWNLFGATRDRGLELNWDELFKAAGLSDPQKAAG
jgi:hypothetical protein